MPTAEEHRAISRRNERFFDSIVDSEWPDWAMTVLFYAALHELAALARERNLPFPENHKEMKTVLRNEGWQDLATRYAVLLSRSYRARYKGLRYSRDALIETRDLLHQLRVDIAELPAPEAPADEPSAPT
jgi:hypothetical protein